jgi:hypothetical protein
MSIMITLVFITASHIIDMMCNRILAHPGYYAALVGQNLPDALASEADDAGDATMLDTVHLFNASTFPEPTTVGEDDIAHYMWATLCIPRWATTYVLKPFAHHSTCHYTAMAVGIVQAFGLTSLLSHYVVMPLCLTLLLGQCTVTCSYMFICFCLLFPHVFSTLVFTMTQRGIYSLPRGSMDLLSL